MSMGRPPGCMADRVLPAGASTAGHVLARCYGSYMAGRGEPFNEDLILQGVPWLT